MGCEQVREGVSSNGVYLNRDQLTFFRDRLLVWRAELVSASRTAIAGLQEGQGSAPDPIDCGALQAGKERNLEATRRYELLITRIDHALRCINRGTYGYCELTGEPIGLQRLLALPLATLTVEAQEQLERSQRSRNR